MQRIVFKSTLHSSRILSLMQCMERTYERLNVWMNAVVSKNTKAGNIKILKTQLALVFNGILFIRHLDIP